MITIGEYDLAEAAAIKKLTYPAIRAFQPAAFSKVNFPVRVTAESELLRYADCMHELADRKFYFETLTYSEAEASAMLSVGRAVHDLTSSLFARATQAFMNLFPPILVMRAIEHMYPDTATIWEIGPGSGYLGAYIIKDGKHRYRAVDNTQALYLWQERFFRFLAGNDYKNYARDFSAPRQINERVASLPWWQYAQLFEAPPKADVIVCDAAMGEMDAFAANYVIRLAAEMLKDSGVFIFRNIGAQIQNSMDYIEQRFAKAGFIKTATATVTVFSMRPITLPDIIPPIGPASGMRAATDFLNLDRSKLLDSYKFFDFIKLRE